MEKTIVKNNYDIMKKVLYLPLIITVFVFFISSCTKKPDIENTSTVKMAGEWFVQTFEEGGTSPIVDFQKIMTYNTSDPNSGQIWMDD